MRDEGVPARPRVLVVEDEPGLADVYARWLAEAYEVETVSDGEAAIEAYDEHIDVVFLDRRLPGVSGDRVLEHVRESGGRCRVAMVSAVTPDFDIYDMGFDDYLVKPVSGAELLDLVERLLRINDYDEGFGQYFALASKLALLQEHKSAAELEESEVYAELEAEFEELDRGLTALASEMTAADMGAVLRDA